jgi:hypothetical protein
MVPALPTLISSGADMTISLLKVMRTWGLTPSLETYLTLACAYARHGDIAAMEKVIADSAAQGLPFRYHSLYMAFCCACA